MSEDCCDVCGYHPRECICRLCEAAFALRADRDEALQWIRELLPYAEASLGGTKLRAEWLAECRGFLGRER